MTRSFVCLELIKSIRSHRIHSYRLLGSTVHANHYEEPQKKKQQISLDVPKLKRSVEFNFVHNKINQVVTGVDNAIKPHGHRHNCRNVKKAVDIFGQMDQVIVKERQLFNMTNIGRDIFFFKLFDLFVPSQRKIFDQVDGINLSLEMMVNQIELITNRPQDIT
ncbi:hypothetical protein MTP99_001426 [Tenebrio molitor]|nr:hypothetical protein MTP99_001426 [Tenebrio molitor]